MSHWQKGKNLQKNQVKCFIDNTKGLYAYTHQGHNMNPQTKKEIDQFLENSTINFSAIVRKCIDEEMTRGDE